MTAFLIVAVVIAALAWLVILLEASPRTRPAARVLRRLSASVLLAACVLASLYVTSHNGL